MTKKLLLLSVSWCQGYSKDPYGGTSVSNEQHIYCLSRNIDQKDKSQTRYNFNNGCVVNLRGREKGREEKNLEKRRE